MLEFIRHVTGACGEGHPTILHSIAWVLPFFTTFIFIIKGKAKQLLQFFKLRV